MPTPFQHLIYADCVILHPELPAQLRRRLQEARGPYLLGSTAGDVQVITAAPRVSTHFYHLADIGVRPAVGALLTAHPELANPATLPAEHAAFLAGYVVHLVWDEVWARDIFLPLYRNLERWQARREYILHHNALRVMLDRRAYAALSAEGGIVSLLCDVHPSHWLPFATDEALVAWRDWLVEQLSDPDTVQTAAVFAQRMQVPVDEVEALVSRMQAGIYDEVSEWDVAIRRYEAQALTESVEALSGLFQFVGAGLTREKL